MKNEMNNCITDWLDSDQAADFLKIDKGTLLNLTSNGKIPYYKFGKANRYLISELDRLLRSKPKGVREWELNLSNLEKPGLQPLALETRLRVRQKLRQSKASNQKRRL